MSSGVDLLAATVKREFDGRFSVEKIEQVVRIVVAEDIDRIVLRSMSTEDIAEVFESLSWGMRRALVELKNKSMDTEVHVSKVDAPAIVSAKKVPKKNAEETPKHKSIEESEEFEGDQLSCRQQEARNDLLATRNRLFSASGDNISQTVRHTKLFRFRSRMPRKKKSVYDRHGKSVALSAANAAHDRRVESDESQEFDSRVEALKQKPSSSSSQTCVKEVRVIPSDEEGQDLQLNQISRSPSETCIQEVEREESQDFHLGVAKGQDLQQKPSSRSPREAYHADGLANLDESQEVGPSDKEEQALLRNTSSITPSDTIASSTSETFIGFVGSSGAGKSTSLVSLLNGCDILPRSSMQACTSSVIELRYRKSTSERSDEDKYMAHVEFMSKEEWDNCLEEAIDHHKAQQASIQAAGGDTTKLQEALADSSNLASVSRIMAVYGRLYSSKVEYEQNAPAFLAEFLGTTKPYASSSPSDVKGMVGRYLSTGKDRSVGNSVWAIVKCARIYGPWLMLSGGLVLVDLPGLQDADAARNEVVDTYVDKCQGIVLVSPVHRATDDKVTKDLVTDRLQQRIRNGQVKYLAFMATKTDNVREREIVDELGSRFNQLYLRQVEAIGVEDMSRAKKARCY